MTLSIVWRDQSSNIQFFSDFRVNLGSASSDFGIKVVRIPFNIYGPNDVHNQAPLITSGDIGMTFAGTTVLPLMVREALAEILFRVQAMPGYSNYDMDAVSDLLFNSFDLIARDADFATNNKIDACIVFAGYCTTKQTYRAFLMDVTRQSLPARREILAAPLDIEIVGSGKAAASALIATPATQKQIINALQAVIDDPSVPTVGGNIQYGSFRGSNFQPFGVIKTDATGLHYWRGPLDLNAPPFEPGSGLVPNFPYLDLDSL